MGDEAAEILKKALHLPPAERAELAGSLIESLDESRDESVQGAWDAEVVRRMEDLDTGRVKAIPLEEALKKISSAVE
jgi:putative addiction module component (TIGR02574 family)